MSFDIVRKEKEPVEFHWGDKMEEGSWSFHPPELNRAFLDVLKAVVPFEDRMYDPANQLWTISADYGDEVGELMEEYFPNTVVVWNTAGGVE